MTNIFNDAVGLTIRNKEVKSITINNGEDELYVKPKIPSRIILEYTGNSFVSNMSNPLESDGEVVIDWGDGSTETYSGTLNHNYESSGDYTISITGFISKINRGNGRTGAFTRMSGLKSVIVSVENCSAFSFADCPDLVSATLEEGVVNAPNQFVGCSNLNYLYLPKSYYPLYWTIIEGLTPETISIPKGMSDEYISREFPSGSLVERSE